MGGRKRFPDTIAHGAILVSTSLVVAAEVGLTPAQVEVVRRSIAIGATDEELALFLATAARLRLDPFAGQIYFVKRRQRDPHNRENWIEAGSAQVGIKGLRRIAARSGHLGGIRRGVERDPSGNPVLGWAEVHRTDWASPVREEVTFEEACQTTREGKPQGLWATRPAMMLKKAAERAALEVAFPVGEDIDTPALIEARDVVQLPDGRELDPVTGEIAEHVEVDEDEDEEPADLDPGPLPGDASARSLALESTAGSSSAPEQEPSLGEGADPASGVASEDPGGQSAGPGAGGPGAGTRPPVPPPRVDDDSPAPEAQWARAAEIFGSQHEALRAASAHLGRTVSQKNITRGELAAVIAERLGAKT